MTNPEQGATEPMLTCPLCAESDFDRTGMALHFIDCEPAHELRDVYRQQAQKELKARLKGFKI